MHAGHTQFGRRWQTIHCPEVKLEFSCLVVAACEKTHSLLMRFGSAIQPYLLLAKDVSDGRSPRHRKTNFPLREAGTSESIYRTLSMLASWSVDDYRDKVKLRIVYSYIAVPLISYCSHHEYIHHVYRELFLWSALVAHRLHLFLGDLSYSFALVGLLTCPQRTRPSPSY